MRPLPRYAPLENVLLAMVTEAVEESLTSPDYRVMARVESARIKDREARSEAKLTGQQIMVVDQSVFDVDVRVARTLLDSRGGIISGDIFEMTVTITSDDVWKRLLSDSLQATVTSLLPRWSEEYPPAKGK